MTTLVKKGNEKKFSFKTGTVVTFLSVTSAVTLPWIFHFIGALSGIGTVPGEVFLPMHIPLILTGLFAGPLIGLISGFFSPLISFALSGMPGVAMLPFIVIELSFYGLISGILGNVRFPTIIKVLIAQLVGRIAKTIAILFSICLLGNEVINVSVIWSTVLAGLPGMLLQLVIIPLLIFRVENRKQNNDKE